MPQSATKPTTPIGEIEQVKHRDVSSVLRCIHKHDDVARAIRACAGPLQARSATSCGLPPDDDERMARSAMRAAFGGMPAHGNTEHVAPARPPPQSRCSRLAFLDRTPRRRGQRISGGRATGHGDRSRVNEPHDAPDTRDSARGRAHGRQRAIARDREHHVDSSEVRTPDDGRRSCDAGIRHHVSALPLPWTHHCTTTAT